MADSCSPRGLSGSPDEGIDGECPWIELQTRREQFEVLVGAPQIGKAAFVGSYGTHTQCTRTGRANQTSQRGGGG